MSCSVEPKCNGDQGKKGINKLVECAVKCCAGDTIAGIADALDSPLYRSGPEDQTSMAHPDVATTAFLSSPPT